MQRLWCVQSVPRKKRNEHSLVNGFKRLLDGPGEVDLKSPKAMAWMVTAMVGLDDHRTPKYEEFRQRLVVFEDRKDALQAARKATNEFWIGKVREVRFTHGTRGRMPNKTKGQYERQRRSTTTQQEGNRCAA